MLIEIHFTKYNTKEMRMVRPSVLGMVGLRCDGQDRWNKRMVPFAMEIAREYREPCDLSPI